MDKLRQMLAAIAALTLLLSAVSGVAPNYFAVTTAFADDGEDGSDDSSSDQEQYDNNESNDNDHQVEATFGDDSNITLEVDNNIKDGSSNNEVEADLSIEVRASDLEDGTYNVTLACDSPDMNSTFGDELMVDGGEGEFDQELVLTNGTSYQSCEVIIGTEHVSLPDFSVSATASTDQQDEQDDNDDHSGNQGSDDNEERNNDNNNGRGHEKDSQDDQSTDDENDNHEDNNASGNQTSDRNDDDHERNGNYTEDERHDIVHKRIEKIRNVISHVASEGHGRDNANPASPGDFDRGTEYVLTAEGSAIPFEGFGADELLSNVTTVEATGKNVTVQIDMEVWKSNSALVLLSIHNGTIEVGQTEYKVMLGFGIYSIEHNAMGLGAFVTDDQGNFYRLKLRGTADDEGAKFPAESGDSIDMQFMGIGGHARNAFGVWGLDLQGTVEAQ